MPAVEGTRSRAPMDQRLSHLNAIAALSQDALRGIDPRELFERASLEVVDALHADRAGVFEFVRDDGVARLVSGAGWSEMALEHAVLPFAADDDASAGMLDGAPMILGDVAAPGSTAFADVAHGAAAAIIGMDGAFGVLAVFTEDPVRLFSGEDLQFLRAIAGVLATAIERRRSDDALRSSEQRLSLAQSIAHMGSYDWDIKSDTNLWSDELYRIYGTEPQSFNASYERFLSFIHPDDRERIIAIHQQAYRDRAPYEMEERIIRPDGSLRILQSNGIVLTDELGEPARMVGICFDVTEQKRMEAETRRSADRFRALVASAPDAVLVTDAAGIVQIANDEARRMFGDDIVGVEIDRVLPGAERPFDGAPARAMGTGLDVRARTRAGDRFVDVSVGPIRTDDEPMYAAFVRDASARRNAEQVARAAHEIALRRRQALEINDNIAQGLASVVYSLELGRGEHGLEAARATLAAVRAMMTDLLGEAEDQLDPGALVRERAAPSLPARGGGVSTPCPRRILIADDSDDMRMLLRAILSASPGIEIVAESADGESAVEAVALVRPDVVLLDLAMPGMDGLEAIPLIKQRAPNSKIVVVSGFEARRMRAEAVDRGADAYVEKGGSMSDLIAVIDRVCPAPMLST